MARALAFLTTLAMLAMALAWAGDESLPDPTQPPAMLMQPPAKPGEAGPASAPVLKAVILREGAKPAAVIGDQVVELGGRFGDAKLVKLSPEEAVLLGPGGRQVLRLVPEMKKKPAKSAKEGVTR